MKKYVFLLLSIILLTILTGCASMSKIDDNNVVIWGDGVGRNTNSIEVSLQDIKLSVKNKDFRFSLKVTNKTDMDIAIPNAYLFWFESGETNGWIVIKNENDKEIYYLGTMASVYMEDLTIDDCTVVKAKESTVFNFRDLYESYDFDCRYCEEKYKELIFRYQGPLGESEVVSIDKFD